MPAPPTTRPQPGRATLRDRLETDARIRYPELSVRLARRRLLRLRRRDRPWHWLALVMFIVMLVPPRVDAAPEDGYATPAEATAGSLLFRADAGRYGDAPRRDAEARSEISELIARVTPRQHIRNDGTGRVEGVSVFPTPSRLHVIAGLVLMLLLLMFSRIECIRSAA